MSCIQLDVKQFAYCSQAYKFLYNNQQMCLRFSEHIERVENIFINLITFNQMAVNQRYKDSGMTNIQIDIVQNRKDFFEAEKCFNFRNFDERLQFAMQCYKFIQSIDYQNCDSDEYLKWSDLNFFKEIKNDVLGVILKNNDYDNLKWIY